MNFRIGVFSSKSSFQLHVELTSFSEFFETRFIFSFVSSNSDVPRAWELELRPTLPWGRLKPDESLALPCP